MNLTTYIIIDHSDNIIKVHPIIICPRILSDRINKIYENKIEDITIASTTDNRIKDKIIVILSVKPFDNISLTNFHFGNLYINDIEIEGHHVDVFYEFEIHNNFYGIINFTDKMQESVCHLEI